MLGILLLTFAAQFGCSPRGPIMCPSSQFAFFEFAPPSGAGMGSACACTTPTGAKGEAMTFSRASSATCLKTVGASPQTIANGDMVTCTSNQPRVMPGADGTGVQGLLDEGSRVKLAIQSQAFDNAAWTASAAGLGSAPIVTPNAGVAPDGTTTAERVQFGACAGAGDASIIFQIGLGTTGSNAGSTFCKGTSADQTISVCVFSSGGGSACSAVTCPAAGWRPIAKVVSVTTSGGPVFGCNNNTAVYSGGSSTGAADVLLWGGGYEAGAYASSYVATTTIAVTRAEEVVADFPLSISLPTGYSIAANVTGSDANVNAGRFHGVVGNLLPGNAGGSSSFDDSFFSAQWAADTTATTPTLKALTTSYTNGSRWATYYDGAVLGACKDSTCATVSATYSAPTWTRWRAGAYSTGNGFIDGVIKRVCIDPSPTRCR